MNKSKGIKSNKNNKRDSIKGVKKAKGKQSTGINPPVSLFEGGGIKEKWVPPIRTAKVVTTHQSDTQHTIAANINEIAVKTPKTPKPKKKKPKKRKRRTPTSKKTPTPKNIVEILQNFSEKKKDEVAKVSPPVAEIVSPPEAEPAFMNVAGAIRIRSANWNDKSETINYTPFPGFQYEFAAAGEKEVFCGGEAGGGKSLLLILDAATQVHEPGYKAVIFRRTYPDLEELIEEARKIYVPLGAKFNSSTHTFIWPNRAVIKFRHLQHIKDLSTYQGQSYDYIGFDELPHFPKIMYTYLFSRLRGKNPNIKRYIRSTGNPDGAFVSWVKHRFVTNCPPNTTRHYVVVDGRDIEVPEGTPESVSRRFIPCIRSQNSALMKNDPHYEAMLNQLPENLKQALKYGKWDTLDKPDQLVETKWWEAALEGKNEFKDNKLYTIGNDFGHSGKDLSVECLGVGNKPYRFRSWNITKTNEMADKLAETARIVGRYRCIIGVDCIGPGAGVGDDLEAYHTDVANKLERCTHKDENYEPRYRGQIEFDNLRSQMCWALREDFMDGNIDLSAFLSKEIPKEGEAETPGQDDGYFEDFYMLQEEVLAHTFNIHNGKLVVISKEQLKKAEFLGRSPNYADALIIWNWTRRLHIEREPMTPFREYEIDPYMKNFLADEGEYPDEGEYAYENGYDEGVYDD